MSYELALILVSGIAVTAVLAAQLRGAYAAPGQARRARLHGAILLILIFAVGVAAYEVHTRRNAPPEEQLINFGEPRRNSPQTSDLIWRPERPPVADPRDCPEGSRLDYALCRDAEGNVVPPRTDRRTSR